MNYKLYAEKFAQMTFEDAKTKCEGEGNGVSLPIPRSQDENNFIMGILDGNEKSWLGITDEVDIWLLWKNPNKPVKENENVWKGLDDVVIGVNNCGSVRNNGKCVNPSFAGPHYANWGPNQPDNLPIVLPDTANHVRMDETGEWYDAPKTNNHFAICLKREITS